MLFCIRSSFEINSQVASSKAKQRDCQGIVDECRAGNSRKYPWQEQLKAKKCGGKEAYYWLIQTRSADEPPTQFFKCVKCKHTWRDRS